MRITQSEYMVCDVCGHKYEINQHNVDDFLEVQEFHHIRFTGGYGSVFADQSTFELDICQHCLKEHLGRFFREERLKD